MAMNRRQFIQITGGGVGAAALGSGLVTNFWGLDQHPLHDPGTDGDRVVPTFCEMCFWKCGVLAHVKQGQVTKIVGNPAHPLSRGRICARGTGGTGLLYDPDRLKRPMIRTQKRGEDVFEEVSWDRALDEVAEKLLRIKDRHGPEALALFSHGYGGSWFQHLARAFGTANIGAPGEAQCRAAREVGFNLTTGAPVGSPENVDMPNARAITLIGSHLGENMHNTQVQDLSEAIRRGAQLLVVDPRYSTVAGKARYWLPIKPGTDIALILAWMNVIIEEGHYDIDYVTRYTAGFEQLKEHVKDKTPEWAFTHTTIEPQTIRETARFIAGARPATVVHPGRRTAWYGDDAQRTRAIAILNALLGSYGRKGGFFLPPALSVPKYPTPKYAHEPKAPADIAKGTAYPFAESVLAHGLRDASIPGFAEYDIKGWMVYGTNLSQALPQPERTREALQHLDFMVAIDVLPVEICGWADVVLPEATYLERYDDLSAPPYREPHVALRQPVVEPLYESKPGWWIAKELGQRMGLGDYFPWEDVEAYLGARVEAGGYDMKTLRQTGVIVGKRQPLYIEEGIDPTFPTKSKKIELFSEELAAVGLGGLPDFVPPEEPDTARGEFRLLFGRHPVHTFSRTANNRLLGEIENRNVVWVNKRVAKERGLNCGDWVRLINQDGVKSEPIQVKATQRIRPDCVYMVHGFGARARRLKYADGKGASDTHLVTRVAVDPIMGGTGMYVNFVTIEPAQPGEVAQQEVRA